jgi:hypothetical protein
MSAPITDRAAIVLQQIDAELALAEKATPGPWRNIDTGAASVLHFPDQPKTNRPEFDGVFYLHTVNRREDATFIATSRTLLPASLRCLKTAIGSLKAIYIAASNEADSEFAAKALTAILDTWEAAQ